MRCQIRLETQMNTDCGIRTGGRGECRFTRSYISRLISVMLCSLALSLGLVGVMWSCIRCTLISLSHLRSQDAPSRYSAYAHQTERSHQQGYTTVTNKSPTCPVLTLSFLRPLRYLPMPTPHDDLSISFPSRLLHLSHLLRLSRLHHLSRLLHLSHFLHLPSCLPR